MQEWLYAKEVYAENGAWVEQGGVNINEMFGLSQEEELMESFEVELRQTYSCNHNTLSKPQEVSCSLGFQEQAAAETLSTRNSLHSRCAQC